MGDNPASRAMVTLDFLSDLTTIYIAQRTIIALVLRQVHPRVVCQRFVNDIGLIQAEDLGQAAHRIASDVVKGVPILEPDK